MKKSEIVILIVDDDPSVRNVLSEAVKRLGYKVEKAKHPDEALSIVKLKRINLAVVDCMLPAKSGIDLVSEFRSTAFSTNPVILISGIFKDSSFIQETKEKEDIVDYLVKPFDINYFCQIINQTLEPLVDAPKIALHSLLSINNNNSRVWRKSIDSIEEVRGYDLALIVCILLDPKISGHLNLVGPDGEIYGISFLKGLIVKVDTPNTEDEIKLLLTQHGLLYNSDLTDFEKERGKGDILKTMAEKSYISPHMIPVIRTQQLLNELKNLMTNQVYKFNFSPDRSITNFYNLKIDINTITPTLHELLFRANEHDWLVHFFSEWYDHPIEKGEEYNEKHLLFQLPIICRLKNIQKYINENYTIKKIIEEVELKEWEVLNAVHLLSIRRVIRFSESKNIENFDKYKSQMNNLYLTLEGIPKHEIFYYFGCSKNLRPFEVAKVYKEFSKTYHPDKLPANLKDKELITINQKLFSLVSEAYSIFSNEVKRKNYFDSLKQIEAQNEMLVDDLLEKMKKHIVKREFKEARKCINHAETLSESDNIILMEIFLDIKEKRENITEKIAKKYQEKVTQLTKDLIKNEYYYLILGILNNSLGQKDQAKKSFQRALNINKTFLEAKRELSQIDKGKLDLKELLTGDMSSVFKHLFKSKK